MPGQRKSGAEPTVPQEVEAASAAPAKKSKTARVRTAAVTPRSRIRDAVSPPAAVHDSSAFHEEIARLAYSYWEARQSPQGSPEEDWSRAERELRARTRPVRLNPYRP